MKKNILALSLTLCLPFASYSFAQDLIVDENRAVDDAAVIDAARAASEGVDHSLQDHEEQDRSSETTEQYLERMRPIILRLYPDYVKEDEEDSMLYRYIEHYQTRQQYLPYFKKAQHSMQSYVTDNQPIHLRTLDPDQSKLDAVLYQDLEQIYVDMQHIQQALQPYLKFNASILQQVDFDAPFPAFTQQDFSRYRNAVEEMKDTYQKQANALVILVNHIDAYQQKLNQFKQIASKRIYKAHIENIHQLNAFSSVLGRFLSTQLKANDAFYMSSRGYHYYQIEEHSVAAEKFKIYQNSAQNQQRIQPLLASLPHAVATTEQANLKQQFKEKTRIQQRCQTQWFDENDVQFVVNGRLDYAKIEQYCEKNKQDLQQFIAQKISIEALPYQSASLTHLGFLGDFHRYEDALYYTDSEQNAVYRFDLKSLQEQRIYQHVLNLEKDGCDHNMCRGVGATDVVLSKNGKIAYVASLDYNQVFAIDLASQQVIEKYQVERYPRKLLLDESGEFLFVYNGVANSISKIKLASGQIETKALPQSHQGHFCREIDLSFSPISGAIKILGDWPDDPYVYMNTQDMHFYQSEQEVPFDDIYLHDRYQYVVKISQNQDTAFMLYDLRLNRVVQQVDLNNVEEDEASNNYAWQNSGRLKMMGDLTGIGHYFVEQSPDVSVIENEERKKAQPDSYHLHIYQKNQGEAALFTGQQSFKLAFEPFKIVALPQQKILVLGAQDGYTMSVANKKIAIYDLKDAENQRILERNRSKLQAGSELKFTDITQDDRY